MRRASTLVTPWYFSSRPRISNAGAVRATGPAKIAARLATAPQVPGRLEILHDDPVVLRDYAHTPDALINVLATIQKLRKGHEKIITVVGAGGDRDKTKRPLMGAAAAEYSDKVIFTSDNPRSEEPEQIIRDMEAGLNTAAKRKYISITDRKEAIRTAISLAGPEDIVLVAGKGHEKYQEIKGVKYPFDDKQILLELFELLDK